MREETANAEVVVVTVETPGIPVIEKSSIVVVESAPPETTFPTMNWVLVELRDCTGWMEKNPLFTVEEKVETEDPVSI